MKLYWTPDRSCIFAIMNCANAVQARRVAAMLRAFGFWAAHAVINPGVQYYITCNPSLDT